MTSNLVTITGPSGSGKTELIKALEKRGTFGRLISVTTRPIRKGELYGIDYYFISKELFQDYEETSSLVQSVHFNGYDYGTTIHELERVLSLKRTPIVIVEPSGVPHFAEIAKEQGLNHIKIFVTAGLEMLVERYLQRINEPADPARLRYHAKRIAAISDELNWNTLHDYDLNLYNGDDNLTHIDRMAEFVEKLYSGQGGNAT